VAAGAVRVPALGGQQHGLLSLPVPRVHHLQPREQLHLDAGDRAAARPRLLGVMSQHTAPPAAETGELSRGMKLLTSIVTIRSHNHPNFSLSLSLYIYSMYMYTDNLII